MKLRVMPTDLRAIKKQAEKNFPLECCGLMLGKFGRDAIEVCKVVEAKNVLGSPVEFEVDPEFVFKAIDHAEREKLELVGIYHSHPNIPVFVSPKDSEIMGFWPRTAWLILSVNKGHVMEQKVFAQKNGDVEELELEVAGG